MLYSRQGTTETIEEVEAEQDEGEAEQDGEAKQDEEVGVRDTDDEGDEAAMEAGSEGPEEEEEEEEEAEEAEETEESEPASLTLDTELPQYSTEDGDVEVPPSYSKAVSFERLSFCSRDDSEGPSHMAVSPDDSRSDRLESSILPPLTHELTASELLLNK